MLLNSESKREIASRHWKKKKLCFYFNPCPIFQSILHLFPTSFFPNHNREDTYIIVPISWSMKSVLLEDIQITY